MYECFRAVRHYSLVAVVLSSLAGSCVAQCVLSCSSCLVWAGTRGKFSKINSTVEILSTILLKTYSVNVL